MLCFFTTDAAIEAKTLAKAALNEAVAKSFNRITVDGDMSTNDTVLVLANGWRAIRRWDGARAGLRDFQAALDHVTLELAKKIVLDGEGVSRFVTVRVSGAQNDRPTRMPPRARWPTARWSRPVGAAATRIGAASCARLAIQRRRSSESRVDVGYSLPGSRRILYSLKARAADAARPSRRFAGSRRPPAFDLHINLNLGTGTALMYAADLTEAYVDFNKGDVNDPTTLGG